MSVFQIDKTSHLVTLSPDLKLTDVKKRLVKEGFYLGYSPLTESDYTLAYYLSRAPMNLYYFKFGSLRELVSSATVELPDGTLFHFKDAPRAALGPDFNRVVVGSRNEYGTLKTVTLRVQPVPETIIHGLVFLDHKEDAKKIIQKLISQHAKPLYFKYFNPDDTKEITQVLRHRPSKKNDDVLMICFSGLQEWCQACKDVLENLAEEIHEDCVWIDGTPAYDVVNAFIYKAVSYADLKEQYRSFLWPTTNPTAQAEFESDFLY